jgi:16S rRNA (guanine527-N7)-methyltransferase
MNEEQAKKELKTVLGFSSNDIERLEIFRQNLINYNKKYNLISKNTEKSVWNRHILDSAQLMMFFKNNYKANLVDLGSGAGFPGIVIAILNKKPEFHVKLYEKSPVKRDFLNIIKDKLDIEVEIAENIYNDTIHADIIVCRAFKKLNEIIRISREIAKKPHKIIILKGKSAQSEINNVSLDDNCSYKLEKSITDIDSKIVIINAR